MWSTKGAINIQNSVSAIARGCARVDHVNVQQRGMAGVMDVDGVVASLKKVKTKADRAVVVSAAAASHKPLKCAQLEVILRAVTLAAEKESVCLELCPLLIDRENLGGVLLSCVPRTAHAKIIQAVSTMPPPAQAAPLEPGPLDMDALIASLKKASKPDREAQVKAAAASGKCLKCEQLAALLYNALPLPSEKEAAIIALYPCLTDKEALEKGDVMAGLNPNNKNNVLKAIGR
mmetsp:Transcript_8920/g.22425  ORF Transcript_8920/g.22425 Transcript_8920/m.22425 type:complete len:233 (+) Transcript_8920:27-725(+)